MLRLLPDRWYAGLFGQNAWLANGAGTNTLAAPQSLPGSASPPELLDALLQASPQRRSGSKLSVMVPSQSTRCISVPWSAGLRGEEELQAYALAHLERAGLGALDGHAVHAEFRHYGAQGFAYAVPRLLLDELHAVARRHDLDLTTALPIVGVAHLTARRARGAGCELTLIAEEASVGALAMDRNGLQRFDAEPAVGGQGAALRRLLTRLGGDEMEIQGITLCAERNADELESIAGNFAANAVQRVNSSQWRRFL